MTDPAAPDSPAGAAPAAPKATPEKSSVFDDLVDVCFSPRNVFARSTKKGFGAAFFILWLLLAAVTLGSKSIYEPVLDVQMAKVQAQMAQSNPNATPEQTAAATAAAAKFGGFFATAGFVIGPPIAMLVLGLFVWLVGRMFGAQVNAGQGMLIATYAYVPRFLGALAVLGLSFVTDLSKATNMAQFSLGPARFMDPSTSTAVLSLLSRVDVAVFWGTALIAMGYAAIGKLKTGSAWGAAIMLWLLGAVPVVLGALRGG